MIPTQEHESDQQPYMQGWDMRNYEIPAGIYAWLVVIKLVMLVYLFGASYVMYLLHMITRYVRYRMLLMHVRKGYKQYRNNGNITILYENFKTLHHVKPCNNGSWHLFWNRLECAFFDPDTLKRNQVQNDHDFLQEIEQWIYYFEKRT